MSPLLALLAATAHAATVQVCINVDVNFDDSDVPGATEDHWADNGPKALRGVKVVITETFGAQASMSAFAETTGTDAGCATFDNISTTPGDTYDISIRSSFEVGASTIDVRNSAPGNAWFAQTVANQHAFTSTNLTLDGNVGPHRVWNVGGAAAYALARHGSGRALTPTFYVTDSSGVLTSPCGGPCVQGDDVYIHDDGARLKFAIAYQLGWVLADRIGVGSLNWASNQPSACTSTGDKDLSSVEYWPAAAADGLAHFYAASAFNDLGDDCGYTTWRDMDFDGMGPPCFDEVDTAALRPLSCATGRAPLVPATDQLAYCEASSNVALGNASTSIDFLRLWWDIASHEPEVVFRDVVDIYVETQPPTWNAATEADWAGGAQAVVPTWNMPVADYLAKHGIPAL